MKKILSIIFLFGILFYSCKKSQTYPDTPSIKFESFSIKDTISDFKYGILTFSFIDGNGDIGLNEDYTTGIFAPDSQYYYNLIITLYRLNNGVFEPYNFETSLNYRFPYYASKGKDKAVKGRMIIDNLSAIRDTLKYQFYIYDRALNKSNVETTPVFIVN
jgi:hypothetical protein